jgi:BASS family bile acid:Na+ symporter
MTATDHALTLKIILTAGVAIIMFGLGLGLTTEDFKRVLKFPKAIAIGLIVQTMVLPLLAFLLCRAFRLPSELAVGLMLLAASPGGFTSNIYSSLAGGDVALNLTLTSVNSVLSAVTLPVLLGLSVKFFANENHEIGAQFSKAIEVFAVVLIPVALGIGVRQKHSNFALSMKRPIRTFSILFLFLLVVGVVYENSGLFREYLDELAGVVIAFNLMSLSFGYAVPRLFRLPRDQSIAIAMEIGIHNSALAMTIAYSVFGKAVYAMPAALYAVVMLITAAIFATIVSKRPRS